MLLRHGYRSHVGVTDHLNQMMCRQRQYFEQKKRQQQQGPGAGNQDDADGAGGQAYGDQAPRSLDVLSLNNLAASFARRNGSESELIYMFCSLSNELATHDLFSLANPAAILAQCWFD
jgi:hypothetical protein